MLVKGSTGIYQHNGNLILFQEEIYGKGHPTTVSRNTIATDYRYCCCCVASIGVLLDWIIMIMPRSVGRSFRSILTLLMHSFLVSVQQCQFLGNTQMVPGKYCPGNIGEALYSLTQHCLAMCLQYRNCAAYNYNTSEGTCTRLATPCPLAYSNPVMVFGRLRVRTYSSPECCEWIPFTPGDRMNERLVAEGTIWRAVARTMEGGANYFGYYHERDDVCYVVTSAIEATIINGYPCERLHEVIRQYDSCNTGELDRHAQHQQPCLAGRTLRVIVRQEQPVLSGTHWSSFAYRQTSVVLCLRRFPMKIENCHIRHQKPLKVRQRPPR